MPRSTVLVPVRAQAQMATRPCVVEDTMKSSAGVRMVGTTRKSWMIRGSKTREAMMASLAAVAAVAEATGATGASPHMLKYSI